LKVKERKNYPEEVLGDWKFDLGILLLFLRIIIDDPDLFIKRREMIHYVEKSEYFLSSNKKL